MILRLASRAAVLALCAAGTPAMATDASTEAARLASRFEGLALRPYRCGGPWSIGFGATRDAAGVRVTAHTPAITRAQALALFARDMRAALAAVESAVVVPLTAAQEAALADLVYNVGQGAFAHSGLLRALNSGAYREAAARFDQWNHAAGRVLSSLVRRRAAERELFEYAPD